MKNTTRLMTKSAFILCLFFSVFVNAQDDVQKLADKWTGAYNAFDEKALGNLYTKNAHLYIHGSPMYIGRDVIQAFWKDDFVVENPKTLLTVTHSVRGFDMILVHGDYQVIDRNTADVLGEGRFAHIWHDVDGEWKLDQDLWNQPYEE